MDWRKELSISVKRKPLFRRRKKTWSCRRMKWTYHSLKLESVSWIASRRITLRSSSKIKKSRISGRWLINTNDKSKKLNLIWKMERRALAKTCRSMRFSTRKRKRSTSSWRSTSRTRWRTQIRWTVRRKLLQPYLSICRRIWHVQTSCHLRISLTKWETISSSSRDSWMMLRTQLPTCKLKSRLDSKILRKLRILKAVLTKRWNNTRTKSARWRTKWQTSLPKLTNFKPNLTRKKEDSQLSRSLLPLTSMVSRSSPHTMPCAMTPRRTLSCRATSTTSSMTLRRSWSWTSRKFMLSNSISRRKALSQTIRRNSKSAYSSAKTSTPRSSRSHLQHDQCESTRRW